MRSRSPVLLDAAWWWDPLVEDRPQCDWDAFLRHHAAATAVVLKHTWLGEWKRIKPGRSLELHAFGESIAEPDFDRSYFVMPVWEEAGLSGQPKYEVLTRQGSGARTTIYFGDDDPRALITVAHAGRETPHWLDRLKVLFHPNTEPGDESRRYVVVEPSGRYAIRMYEGPRDPIKAKSR